MDGMCIVYAPNFDEPFIMSLLSSLIVTKLDTKYQLDTSYWIAIGVRNTPFPATPLRKVGVPYS